MQRRRLRRLTAATLAFPEERTAARSARRRFCRGDAKGNWRKAWGGMGGNTHRRRLNRFAYRRGGERGERKADLAVRQARKSGRRARAARIGRRQGGCARGKIAEGVGARGGLDLREGKAVRKARKSGGARAARIGRGQGGCARGKIAEGVGARAVLDLREEKKNV